MVKSLNKPHVIESHVTTISMYLSKCQLHKLLVYKQLQLCVTALLILKHKYRGFFKEKLSVAFPAAFCLQHLVNFKIFKYTFPNTRLHCLKYDSIRVKRKKRRHLREVTGKFICLEQKEGKKQPRT